MNLVIIIIGAVFGLFAILIAIGCGDLLIAGYNTASKEDKAKVNIKRLRLLMVYVCTACAALVFVDGYFGLRNGWFTIILVFWIILPTMILANTWAKRK